MYENAATNASHVQIPLSIVASGPLPAASCPAKILEVRAYRGPNPYGYRPVIRIKLDLGDLENHPTTSLAGFTEKLLEAVPTLREHGCCYGEPGGFVRRLEDGTWLGHVIEHVALELQCLAGTPVTYGKTRGAEGEHGVYNVVYSFEEERVGLMAGYCAIRLIQSLLPENLRQVQGIHLLLDDSESHEQLSPIFDFGAELEKLILFAQQLALGPTTRSLVDEAKDRGIPALRLDDYSLVQLGYGRFQQRIRASVTGKTSHIGLDVASDKSLTRKLLSDAGVPVPSQRVAKTDLEAIRAAERIGYPVVVKPLDGNHGRGVSLNLSNAEEVKWAFQQANEHSRTVIVEKFLEGNDYRVLVVDGRVVAASRRVPACVVGDGKNTIAKLVEIINSDPRRGIAHEKVMTKISIGPQALRLLGCAGFTLETVLPQGETFYLAPTGNMSTGGTAIDVTGLIHPQIATSVNERRL